MTRGRWIMALGVVLPISCLCLLGQWESSTSKAKRDSTPALEYASAADAKAVQAVCNKLAGVYAKNKYGAIKGNITFIGSPLITHTKWDSGFLTEVTLDYSTKTSSGETASLYCATKNDFSGAEFSRRSK